ncbi:MAG: hypothetical protein LBI44_01920 [Oscillospiraceae bacterium]|nr:hypothetical protein [Oscillospiraceae bacterium]
MLTNKPPSDGEGVSSGGLEGMSSEGSGSDGDGDGEGDGEGEGLRVGMVCDTEGGGCMCERSSSGMGGSGLRAK